jgi:hypothetical protein
MKDWVGYQAKCNELDKLTKLGVGIQVNSPAFEFLWECMFSEIVLVERESLGRTFYQFCLCVTLRDVPSPRGLG